MTTIARMIRVILIVGSVARPAAAVAAPCTASTYFNPDVSRFLKVVGTPGRQNVTITLGPTTAILSLDCNGDGDFTDSSSGDLIGVVYDATNLDLQLNGSDTITVTVAGNFAGGTRVVNVRLGPGTNTLVVDGGASTLSARSRLLINLTGGGSTNHLLANFGGSTLDDSSVILRATVGAGSDTATLRAPHLTNRGNFDVDASLGAGINSFTLEESNDIDPGSTLSLQVTGDAGNDTVTTNFAGRVAGNVSINADLAGGNDRYAGNFDYNGFDIVGGGEMRLNVWGGLGADTIVVGRNGTSATGVSDNGLLDLNLNGGAGNDLITVDFGAGGFDQMDGGTFRLRADGGLGNDTLTFTLDSGNTSASTHDISVSGGPGVDTIAFTQNAAGVTNTWVGAAAMIDGSFGSSDTCSVGGSSASNAHKRNCEL